MSGASCGCHLSSEELTVTCLAPLPLELQLVIPTSLCSSSNAVHCSLAVRNCKEVVDYLQVLNSCCLLLLTSLHQYVHFEALQVLSKLTTMSYSLTWRSSAFLFVLMVSLFLPPQMNWCTNLWMISLIHQVSSRDSQHFRDTHSLCTTLFGNPLSSSCLHSRW